MVNAPKRTCAVCTRERSSMLFPRHPLTDGYKWGTICFECDRAASWGVTRSTTLNTREGLIRRASDLGYG
jgi:hypothetical protein